MTGTSLRRSEGLMASDWSTVLESLIDLGLNVAAGCKRTVDVSDFSFFPSQRCTFQTSEVSEELLLYVPFSLLHLCPESFTFSNYSMIAKKK